MRITANEIDFLGFIQIASFVQWMVNIFAPFSSITSKGVGLGCQVNFTYQSFIVSKQFLYQVFTSIISSHYDVAYLHHLAILSRAKSGSFFHKSPELLPLKEKGFPFIIDCHSEGCIIAQKK